MTENQTVPEREGATAIRYQAALALIAAGRFPEAADHLSAAVSTLPDHAHAWFLLGAVYGQMARIEDALRCTERALTLAPDHADARFNAAQACMRLRRLRAAASHYRRVVQARPDHFDALNGLGIACQELGEHDAARHYLAAALRIRPDTAKTRFLLASLQGSETPAPPPPPREYVADLFDHYADRFDRCWRWCRACDQRAGTS